MKTNKIKLQASEEFAKNLGTIMATYYSRCLSEHIKAGIARKKLLQAQRLSTSKVEV